MLMATKMVDFHAVEEHQRGIDKRLHNWALSCNSGGPPAVSPMFRLYRPDNWERGTTRVPVDHSDAVRIAKGVAALPIKHRKAINWAYLKPVNPRRACQEIGVSMDDLALLLRDGRQMLINRKI